MVIVIERRTMNFLPTKQYRIVPGCGLVYHDHETFSTNWPIIHCSRKFYPPEKYPLYGTLATLSAIAFLCIPVQVLRVLDETTSPPALGSVITVNPIQTFNTYLEKEICQHTYGFFVTTGFCVVIATVLHCHSSHCSWE